MRTLTVNEEIRVSGGVVPIAWGLRIGGGAVGGAASAVGAELLGDGLQWSDWKKIGFGAAMGAGLGGLSGYIKWVESITKKVV